MHVEEHPKASVGKEHFPGGFEIWSGLNKISRNLLANTNEKGILDKGNNNVDMLRIK